MRNMYVAKEYVGDKYICQTQHTTRPNNTTTFLGTSYACKHIRIQTHLINVIFQHTGPEVMRTPPPLPTCLRQPEHPTDSGHIPGYRLGCCPRPRHAVCPPTLQTPRLRRTATLTPTPYRWRPVRRRAWEYLQQVSVNKALMWVWQQCK